MSGLQDQAQPPSTLPTAPPTATVPPGGAPEPQTVPTLSGGQVLAVLIIVAVTVLAAGGLVIYARWKLPNRASNTSVVRSWMAISLVLALVLFCVVAMGIDDANLRSTLIGGLTASVGSAVAFYFSTKSADQARQDVLQASGTLETVPDLSGKSETAAAALLGRTSFKLLPDPATPSAGDVVTSQTPQPGLQSARGTAITVTMGTP